MLTCLLHITETEHEFNFPLFSVVRIGVAESGRFVQAEEKGEICLTGERGAQHKFQALHVPSFEKNLLSVSKLD